jgi:hypothetical protein
MYENEIAINQFQVGIFQKTITDLPEEKLFDPSPGHGHPAIWILGHLAITGEYGQTILGGKVTHPEWLPLFGPGSSDQVAKDPSLTRDLFARVIPATYAELQRLATQGDPEILAQPHGFAPFEPTPIKTKGHMVTLLLTNHFGFHLSQLSSCRRVAGHKALF